MVKRRKHPQPESGEPKEPGGSQDSKRFGVVFWAAVGALAAVAGVAIGAFQAFHSSPGGTSSAQVQATLPTATADALVVNTSWPDFTGCDGATNVAVLPGGPSPQGIEGDPRAAIIAAGGASWGIGHLSLLLSMHGDAVASILGIKPLVYQRSQVVPKWTFAPEGGCGGLYTRTFDLNLDAGTIVDEGVQGSGINPGSIPSNPLGAEFTVSRTDPASIVVDAHSCNGLYEWGLRITYVVDGNEMTLDLGSAAKPFRSVGLTNQTVPAYTYSMPGSPDLTALAGVDQPRFSC